MVELESGVPEALARWSAEVAVGAPPTLLPAVLARAGVAHSYAPVETDLGTLLVAHSRRGVSATMRTDDEARFEAWFRERLRRPALRERALPDALARAVRSGVAGASRRRPRYDLTTLRDFERAVLTTTLAIPRGEVRPYGWVAREIGRPAAVRAVGTALARNPVPYLIPCHRVVRNDGVIGEYGGGGPEVKRAILSGEGVPVDELARLARRGVRLWGSDTTRIFCFPTCRCARRIAPRHRVSFTGVDEAAAAGFRPCGVCRPAAA